MAAYDRLKKLASGEIKFLRRKPRCKHPNAILGGPDDWQHLVCADCGEKVSEKDYE